MPAEEMKMKDEPLVMCVTNTVAANFTANCLLAIGAKPAMIEEPCEAEELAACADAALINVGTVNAGQAETMRAAIRGLNANKKPWVLDPVAAHVLTCRRGLVREFLSCGPSLVRGNHAEIDRLGITGITTLATGEVDTIVGADGTRLEISGGVPMLQAVTATGCAQGALCAAFLGRGLAPFEAAKVASELMKRAGERVWEKAKAPGSFKVVLVDELWEMSRK